MRKDIEAIIDQLFRDVEPTEEAKSLREELSADLEDRFDDLLAQGMDEAAALGQLREAVDGFEAVTADLPHRSGRLTPQAGMPWIGAPKAPEAPVIPAAPRAEKAVEGIPVTGLRRLCVRLSAEDLRVEPSPDERIHLLVEGDGQPYWLPEVIGDTLTLTICHDKEGEDDAFADIDPAKLDGLGRLLLRVNRVYRSIAKHVAVFIACTGTVQVPAGWLPALDLQTTSGDIRLDVPAASLTVRTVSGDLTVDLCGPCRKANVTTVSGDIELTGKAEELSVSTTSGDVSVSRAAARVLRLSAVSGDTEFEGIGEEISYKTISGDMDLSLAGPFRSVSGSSVSGDAEIRLCSGQAARIRAKSTSGNIHTSCPEAPDAGEMRLTSVSGDITVTA